MSSIEILTLCLAAGAGLLLGGIFYGGLWWTVRNGIIAKQPGLWFLGSLIVRLTIVMVGFYWVGGGQWPRLVSCLAGFIAARSMVVRWTRPPYPTPVIRSTAGEEAIRFNCVTPRIRSTEIEVCIEPTARLGKESHHAT